MKKLIALIMVLAMVLAVNSTALAAQGETPVTFAIQDSQINVTVPLTIPVTVNASTGVLTFPDTYTITNNSAFAVKIKSIVCRVENGWTLVEAKSGSDDIIATMTPGAGTAVRLLSAEQTCTGTAWNMAANGGVISLTLAGEIGTSGAKTQALTATAAKAFTIVYTVEAGANT